MPLQIGIWTINISGTLGQLTISSVVDGVISGELNNPAVVLANNQSIAGFWDEDSQRITFTVGEAPGQIQRVLHLFEGYLFTTSTINFLGVSGSVIFTLSGYAEGFILNATATKHVFGWYAQIGVD